MHAVVTKEGFWDTESSDRDLEAIDQDLAANDQDPEAIDASYLQLGPARQYYDGVKAALSTVFVDVDVFAIVAVVTGTVQNDLHHGPREGRISIRICRRRRPRSAADSAARW